MVNQEKIKIQIDELIAYADKERDGEQSEKASEVLQGTVTLMGLVYGGDSPQSEALNAAVKEARVDVHRHRIPLNVIAVAKGALGALRRAVDSGLVGNLEREIAGDVLGDFLQLARTALDANTEASKNVASVLAAAAFEDTIRRMGSVFCGIQTREDLQSIVIALKEQEILRGAQFGVVNAHLQFRNDALHAHWEKVERTTVNTALQLVQELLLKHFS